ncbi:hypothetical protein FNV43_RR21391 [Rhamnella rubrinervis]|uniref:Glycosyltransferase 61 catalytic domain-containing protein n=1 Tax=Rhamnella rubrinervis TaxID=2594499 RepID=A0A8K0GVC2_9ROSA|nr:hypothetical protein FNV43_RR21391 [Rhamnella rubrinervis]
MYDSILARSFSKHEQKKLGYGALICCLLIAFFFCSLFKPYLGPLPALNNLQVSMAVGLQMLALKEITNISQPIFEGKDDLGITSSKVSRDTSLQTRNYTSKHYDHLERSTLGSKNVSHEIGSSRTSQHNDWELSTKGSQNVSHEIGNSTSQHAVSEFSTKGSQNVSHEIGNSTSQLTNLEFSTEGSQNVSLQVENSTSHHTDSPTAITTTSSNDQHAETLVDKIVTRKTLPPLCNIEEPRTEFCEIKIDVRIDGNSGSVFVVSSQMVMFETGNNSWNIRPYARKEDLTAMSTVRSWSVKPAKVNEEIPKCSITHNVPAVLFSSGGYVGNNFHEFTDVVIPLFTTSRPYNGEVQLLVTNKRPWFIPKYQKLLKGLSKYEIIDIDKEQQVHCFPSATIGLKRHPKEMSIDPLKHYYSMRDFRDFLRNSYLLKKAKAMRIKDGQRKKPRLLILSRRRTRSFTNTGEISKMAKSLGFKVIVTEADMSLSKFAELVNSCDVLMGVHGAGLTNLVFLPENAIFIQILPIGGFQWLAKTDFGEPSKDMNLKYLEYEIANEESTLIKQYPLDHAVFTDPFSIGRQGWEAFKSIFLEKQNVNLNVNRFRPTLLKALELLHQ